MKMRVLIAIAVIGVGVGLFLLIANHIRTSSDASAFAKVKGDKPSSLAGMVESSQSVKFLDNIRQLYVREQLSEPVKMLLGLDEEEHNYNSLGNAIGQLSKDLSAEDVGALRDLLTWPNDQFPEGMRAIEINAIKNDVLDRLLRQTVLPEGIGLQMVEMASNRDNDPVWRDYCVQFMTPFYERCSAESMAQGGGSAEQSDQSASSAGELRAVQDAMFNALDERGGTIAGTSLIGLELLSRTHDEFNREAIVNSALDIAADESASAASRMTALRLSANVGTTEDTEYAENTASTARLIAQTGETVLLRSAAIVTLGEIGTDADRELLQSYTQDDNQQIASAAKLALEKLDIPDVPIVDRSVPSVRSETTTTQPEPKLPPVLIN